MTGCYQLFDAIVLRRALGARIVYHVVKRITGFHARLDMKRRKTKVGKRGEFFMSICINVMYRGEAGAARAFADEMLAAGTVDAIRAMPGNICYDYCQPIENPDAILLIDRWESQSTLDAYYRSPLLEKVVSTREKYGLKLHIQRFTDYEVGPAAGVDDSKAF